MEKGKYFIILVVGRVRPLSYTFKFDDISLSDSSFMKKINELNDRKK